MRITLEQSFNTAVRPSPRVLQTASMFGIGVDEEHRIEILPRIEIELPSKGIVFITGPSGGGKSSILKAIVRRARDLDRAIIDLNDPGPLPDAPLVDVFDVPLKQAMSLLAMEGLGDAFIVLRRPCELSDGQRARLRLAHAMRLASQSDNGTVIIADEFAATLDRLTAQVVSRNIRRWIDRASSPVTFVAATTHDDLIESLAPDLLIGKGLGDEVEIVDSVEVEVVDSVVPAQAGTQEARCAHLDSRLRGNDDALRIERGEAVDYKALAQFHYRSERAGVVTSAFRVVHESPGVIGRFLNRKSDSRIVGILLRSLPHLSCALRDHATHGRYRGLSQREAAAVINREVRTISRVVIHPQWRGLGLAVDLVRHALAHPEEGQVFTEALAAMGHVHPFFERAGMSRFDRPPRKEHARLFDALARIEIEPFMLASPRAFLERLRGRDDVTQVWFEHELARWARSGARRKRGEGASVERSVEEMLAIARDQLLTLPVYYLHRHLPEDANASHSS